MTEASYKEMPKLMAKQQEEGKKDQYIDITNILINAGSQICGMEEYLDYLHALLETIAHMDFQIYELYRALQDAVRNTVKKIIGEELISEQYVQDFAQIVQKACALKILNPEHYERFLGTESGVRAAIAEGMKPSDASEEGISVRVLEVSARYAVIEIGDGGSYHTMQPYTVWLNGVSYGNTDMVITTLFDLKPQSKYEIGFATAEGTLVGKATFTTDNEFVTLNVRDFGAKGDGESDDTPFIQAAILSCPGDSRVLIPAGVYRITSLFLKSNLRLELAEGATLLAFTERARFVQFPAVIESYDEQSEYQLGTWEGNPLPMFAGILTGIDAENVRIYGRGCLNGNASKENWWKNPKVLNIAYRPRLFFINHCKDVSLVGITCCNSPSWTLHPYFSENLRFYGLKVQNPSDSPNTDGLDPESCKDVVIAGVRFSLGDDCIAVKSGKIYTGKKYKTPSENLHICHCLMENGHGAVTVGSEMAGGVKNLVVEDCVFSHTDRGLRIKTRRGRGKDAILDGIVFRRIDMDHVMTPFVVNSFYFCDPDGKTSYVQSRERMPVDDRTPKIKNLVFEDIDAKNCHVAAAHFDGLPEQKIEQIIMKNVHVTYAEHPKCDVPAMSEGVAACSKMGIFARNIETMHLENVVIVGNDGEELVTDGVDQLQRKE